MEAIPADRQGSGTGPRKGDSGGVPTWFMEQAVERIGTTLDAAVTCRELVEFVSSWLCDTATADLMPTEAPVDRPDAPVSLTRIAQAGEPWLMDALKDVALGGPGGGPVPVRAVAGTSPIIARGLCGGQRLAVMSLPLTARGRVHGVLSAVRKASSFTDDDTALLLHAARLAAVHLAHARSHDVVRGTALNLQRALLAEPGRPHPNLDTATRYLPADTSALISGDWFETVRLHFGRTLLVVGDVMGHDLDAAADMNAYRSEFRYLASTDLPPHRILRRLDAAAVESPSRRPATCLAIGADPARGLVTLASAGHLPPAVFSRDGTASLMDVNVGPPLGTGMGGYELVTRRFSDSETLLLFTDGLVERRGEDIDTSLARLVSSRPPASAGVEEFLDEVLARLDAQHAEDDVAVLAARLRYRAGTACGDLRRRPAG